jgi:hypothetical protein
MPLKGRGRRLRSLDEYERPPWLPSGAASQQPSRRLIQTAGAGLMIGILIGIALF